MYQWTATSNSIPRNIFFSQCITFDKFGEKSRFLTSPDVYKYSSFYLLSTLPHPNPMPPHQNLDRPAVLLSTHPNTASRHRFGSSAFKTITHCYSNKNVNITYKHCITINKVGKDVLTQTLYPTCTPPTYGLTPRSPHQLVKTSGMFIGERMN